MTLVKNSHLANEIPANPHPVLVLPTSPEVTLIWPKALSDPGPSPQDVALRGVMQALVRIQAYMLADIVVAIPAVDLAIEAVV